LYSVIRLSSHKCV